MKRVAICAVAQYKIESDIWYKRFQGMLLDVLEDLQQQTGFVFGGDQGVNNIVSCSDDFLTPVPYPTMAYVMPLAPTIGAKTRWPRKVLMG